MNKVKVDLKYCYGINSLLYEFDFDDRSTYAIYSPNGVMKTSFAKTFKDLSKDIKSEDQIFPENKAIRVITNDNNDILPENVFVIEPYNETYKSEKVSVLLVNAKLKNEYETIHLDIDEKKDALLKPLIKLSGLRANIEETISTVFTKVPTEFYKAISGIKDEVIDDEHPKFDNIVSKKVFSEKIESLLETPDVREKIEQYIRKYDELIAGSKYFKKGIFNHTNASTIAKNLKDNGFFKASHSIVLNSESGAQTVTDEKELTKIIEDEKQSILTNPDLVSIFDNLDKKLSANKEMRDFREYLIANINILPELNNFDSFKDKVWISYFKAQKELFIDLIQEYEKGKKGIEKILKQAKQETTQWASVIDEFNKRFSVPFKLSIGNQEQVILNSQAPIVEFEFFDQNGKKSVTEADLRNVLSAGETRALYLLNIIFEVQARKASHIKTLFVIDDIADSFDYKNKYAIIEYLKDISEIDFFYQIVLTHNYDFFRTISGRLDMGRKQKLNTDKSNSEISIFTEKYQKNPFTHWKTKLSNDNNILIASIPFVRNLAEFTGDKATFLKLTSLLHYKKDTNNITIKDLEDLFKSVLKDQSDLALKNPTQSVIKLIFSVCDALLAESNDQIDLEKKISLSIAIRLKAEIFMVKEISDDVFWESISYNQAYQLSERYLQDPNVDSHKAKIIDQVNLMTPENIHLNSFMYEPILDMSNHHLKSLYREVKNL